MSLGSTPERRRRAPWVEDGLSEGTLVFDREPVI
jgi:hypothetical protein